MPPPPPPVGYIWRYISFGNHVHSCTHWLRPRKPPAPALGLLYEGAIGQPRWTTSLCDPCGGRRPPPPPLLSPYPPAKGRTPIRASTVVIGLGGQNWTDSIASKSIVFIVRKSDDQAELRAHRRILAFPFFGAYCLRVNVLSLSPSWSRKIKFSPYCCENSRMYFRL
jgi:hypothetical protein